MDSTTDTSDTFDSEFMDVLDLYEKICRGYHTVVEESMATEEQFLEFVRHQEDYVRRQWYAAESESQRLNTTAHNSETEYGKSQALIKHIRRQLDAEMDRRAAAEETVAHLTQTLDIFRTVLANNGTITDEDRQRLFRTVESAASSRSHSQFIPGAGIRKSEDISQARISYDDELSGEEEEIQQTERVSTSKRISVKTDGAGTLRLSGEGDIEVVSKTQVIIPEKGPVEARTSLTTRPRRSVAFADTARRSHSVPRDLANPNAPTGRRSNDDTTFMSCEVSSQTSGSESAAESQPRMSRRMSRSVGQALDVLQHEFESRTVTKFDETCSYCKQRIGFVRRGWRCTQCRMTVHEKCQTFAPVPCVPWVSDVVTQQSGEKWLDLEKLAPVKNPRVPTPFVQLVRFIDQNGLLEEGIYRIPGSLEQVRNLKRQMVRNKYVIRMEEVRDVHIACSLLKNLLNSLTEPLLTYPLWQQFASAAAHARHDEIYRLINLLPSANRDTLAFLMQHFRRVTASPATQMSVDNLVKVLAPSLIGNSKQAALLTNRDISVEIVQQQMIMAKLMGIQSRYWGDLLDIDPGRASSSSTLRSGTAPLAHSPDALSYQTTERVTDLFIGGGHRNANGFSETARGFLQPTRTHRDAVPRLNQSSKFQSPRMFD